MGQLKLTHFVKFHFHKEFYEKLNIKGIKKVTKAAQTA